jgi:hypothetical protein
MIQPMGVKRAIISDIHGNLAALEAVLADIREQRIDQVGRLGDIIAYGPHPRECVDLVTFRRVENSFETTIG